MMRYRVKGEPEGSFWDVVDQGVKKGAFRYTETTGDELGIGWTSLEDFTDTEFRDAHYVRGNFVALSLRIDSVRVPARILDLELRKETRKLLQELGLKRLSSSRRRELKERVKESLKKVAFPTIQTFDFIWDTSESLVYFGAHAVKARERMEDHFKKYFGLTLIPLLAFLRARELLKSNADLDRLEQLKPCSMIG
jgi:DNA recombination-dependent growth factor C